MLAILDYQAGNQTSVQRALAHVGITSRITAQAQELAASQGVIFPGVGAAGQAMGHLRASGLDVVLKNLVAQGKPLLGICLGCQVLFEHSTENSTQSLGILPGHCERFAPDLCEAGRNLPVPHMGWNNLVVHQPSVLLKGLPEDAQMYFVHSYYVRTRPEYLIATSHYGHDFCAVAGRDGLWGAQFHVEKSGQAGLMLLHNFYEYCQSVAAQ